MRAKRAWGIRGIALEMKLLAEDEHHPDKEARHSDADELLCKALELRAETARGGDGDVLRELVRDFRRMEKWYA